MNEAKGRHLIVKACHWLTEKELIGGLEGNVSLRLSSKEYLITPSGVSKAHLQVKDVLLLSEEGRVKKGQRKASSEWPMHLAAYRARKDIQAVVHAHPVVATALTFHPSLWEESFLPEAEYVLGKVVLLPYATPGTGEASQALGEKASLSKVFLLPRHGAVTLGETLDEACFLMETLERCAKILWHARLLGPLSPLPKEEVKKIRQGLEKL